MKGMGSLALLALTTMCKPLYLKNNPRLLQKVRPHVCADDLVSPVEADFSVFPKPAAVVIPGGLCITYCLQIHSQSVWHDLFFI